MCVKRVLHILKFFDGYVVVIVDVTKTIMMRIIIIINRLQLYIIVAHDIVEESQR